MQKIKMQKIITVYNEEAANHLAEEGYALFNVSPYTEYDGFDSIRPNCCLLAYTMVLKEETNISMDSVNSYKEGFNAHIIKDKPKKKRIRGIHPSTYRCGDWGNVVDSDQEDYIDINYKDGSVESVHKTMLDDYEIEDIEPVEVDRD